MARPIEYSEDIIKSAKEYIEMCKDVLPEKKVNIPTKGGLAVYLGVHRDTLYDWSQKYPEFSDIMEQLGAEQENRLINNGLAGTYNSTIAKVLLTKHGYREGIEQTGKDGEAIEVASSDIKDLADKLNEIHRGGSK